MQAPAPAAALPPPPPPPRPPPAPFLQALDALWRSDSDYLGAQPFQASGCMRLVMNFEEVVLQAGPEVAGEPGSQQRTAWVCGLVHATMRQHDDWLAGIAASPLRRHWHTLASVHAVPRRSDAAQQRFVAALQAQSIPVQIGGGDYAVPVTAVLGHLPADHCLLVIRGLPCQFALAGVAEALLGAAGYSAATGVTVVHERAGVAPTLGEVESGLPVLDTVVATVVVPQACANLPLLPRTLEGPGWRATLTLQLSVVPAGQLVQRHEAPVRQPAVHVPQPHPGVHPGMARVYAANGLGREAAEAMAGPAAAETLLRGAQAPRCRTGLGFAAAAAEGRPPPAAPAAAAAAPPLPPALLEQAEAEEPMPPAPPLPARPDDPGFDAASEWVLDGVDDCTAGEAEAIVQRARTAARAAYDEAAQVTTPSALPHAFRVALHAQARVVLGEQRTGALIVPPPLGPAGLPADEGELLGVVDEWPLPSEAADPRGRPGPATPAAHPLPGPHRRSPRLTGALASEGVGSWLALRGAVDGGSAASGGKGSGGCNTPASGGRGGAGARWRQ